MKKRHTRQPEAAPDPADRAQPAAETPPEVLSQTCACCGAILPVPLSRLDAIPGREHLRRAVTVALTGNHPITFLGSGAALADALADALPIGGANGVPQQLPVASLRSLRIKTTTGGFGDTGQSRP